MKLEVSNIGCKRSKLWRKPPSALSLFPMALSIPQTLQPGILLTLFRTGRERDKSGLPIIPYNNVIYILSMATQREPSIQGASFFEEENIYVELTQDLLNITQVMDRVKSPKAGAAVLFSGIHCQSSHYKIQNLTLAKAQPATRSTVVLSKSFSIPPTHRSLSGPCSQSLSR